MICPQCGAKQLSSGPRMSPASESAAPEWHDGFARHARTEWNAPAFSFGGAARDSDYEPRDEAPAAPRSWLPFYAIGSVVSIAFLLTAYIVSHRAEREPAQGAQVVEGAILGPKTPSAVPATKPPSVLHPVRSAPPVAVAQLPPPAVSAPPPMTAQVPLPHQVPQAPQAQPRTAAVHTVTLPPGNAARKSSADERALAAAKIKAEKANEAKANAAKASYARADVARNLASARASLDKNNLGPARSAINAALAEQPGNGNALQMQAELTSREDQRDSLLGYARLCARDGRWLCAWHNAGHALTVDSSSGEARAILSRSIAAQGAGNMAQGAAAAPTMRQVDSGPPGPPIDPN
ncbi:hypothetical protein [Paraburkholderia sp. J10-1]|uniref:hypothetical protein n=1 Tax=Paraburkholderia sp. J10-1 TaxID=2805430 RepID=UPI002AB6A5A6|nr:hypothetical protein [Paraburkholderia sp. J10-1]